MASFMRRAYSGEHPALPVQDALSKCGHHAPRLRSCQKIVRVRMRRGGRASTKPCARHPCAVQRSAIRAAFMTSSIGGCGRGWGGTGSTGGRSRRRFQARSEATPCCTDCTNIQKGKALTFQLVVAWGGGGAARRCHSQEEAVANAAHGQETEEGAQDKPMSCARHDCGGTREALVRGCPAACPHGGLPSAVPVRRPPTAARDWAFDKPHQLGGMGPRRLGRMVGAASPKTPTARVGVS